LMGGAITVSTEKGEGTTFTITLPVAFPQNGNGKDLQVLLADGQQESRRVIRHVLEPYVYVAEASSLDEVLDRVKKKRYDAVLLDVDLGGPSLSASEVLEVVREVQHYDEVHIIALSSHAHPGGAAQYRTIGFDDTVNKPIDRETLLDALGHLGKEPGDRREMPIPEMAAA